MMCARLKSPIYRLRNRRGSVLIYSMLLMTILLGVSSLAVDYGREQSIKTELQRSADFTARGVLQLYESNNQLAWFWDYILPLNTFNPVDANSGVTPTVTTTWGYWDGTAFTAGSTVPTGDQIAVQVTVSRTAANGNPVPLTFPLINGTAAIRTTCDVWATAIAVLPSNTTVTTTVQATSDLWLSGMPAGSNAGWSDSPANAPSTLAMNVTPGTTVTFSATGLTMNKGAVCTIGPTGASTLTTHMAGSPDGNYNGLQNGIQSLTAPQNALIGVFLTSAQPSTVTPPVTALDYSTAAARDESNYNSLVIQQPFFIGNGQNGGSTVQTFVVPAGATRMYLGVFDGWQNWDDPGSLTVTTTQLGRVYLVR
jgi:hypothetical protein